MTTIEQWRAVAEAVEKATGPDRETDRAVLLALGWRDDGEWCRQPRWVDPEGNITPHNPTWWPQCWPMAPSASLDAVVALVEREMGPSTWIVRNFPNAMCSASVPILALSTEGVARTPALALLAAFIRAKIVELEQEAA